MSATTAEPSFRTGWRELRRFRRLPRESRRIVVYSESRQDWHHFEPIVARLVRDHGARVCYVSSDPGDPGLRTGDARVQHFLIPKGFWRIVFFQIVDADVFLLTMMDLGNFELRRSLRPVHYVYLFHSLGSTHMADHAASYDHYDTILCAGPHHVREIRKREQSFGLPAKRLVEHGYARLDALLAQRDATPPARNGEATLLVAPTWGDTSLLNVCGERLIGVLLAAGHRVILRPHYMTVRRSPEVIVRICARFGSHARFEYEDRMADTSSLLRAHLLICDWSAMAIEWGLGLEKPALFVDVPPRVRNPDWRAVGLEPLEGSIRGEIGAILDPSRLDEAPNLIDKLLADPAASRVRAGELRARSVYNLGRSPEIAARELARLADERALARERGS
jgi:YidC/Oxa1 family membrane protein insertase